ncbi:MAG: hypothetical protein E6R12_12125 [Sphingomonadales bacterium]|nr:MAG: hypothetical protein E6R12_12125 [Sphingomonadales bacterium]
MLFWSKPKANPAGVQLRALAHSLAAETQPPWRMIYLYVEHQGGESCGDVLVNEGGDLWRLDPLGPDMKAAIDAYRSAQSAAEADWLALDYSLDLGGASAVSLVYAATFAQEIGYRARRRRWIARRLGHLRVRGYDAI